MPVPSVDEYAQTIARLIAPALALRSETVDLDAALGRVTVADVLCPVDLPLFRNSQMDGYAVLAADLANVPVTLPVVGEVSARPSEPPRLVAGTAVRIMTGAVVPDGADAVVPIEDTSASGSTVTIARARQVGEFVRERGSDTRAGDRLLPAGSLLASRHLAALAAAGIDEVGVRARIRVAIITTGSELVAPGAIPLPGQIHDSNAVALAAAVRASGGAVTDRSHVGDEPGAFLAAMTDAAASADLILTSGGISMGAYEVVREVLEPRGGHIGHIAMQPGGPQAHAVFEGVPVVCFPGNPVSTQLSFEVFIAPLLRGAAGLPAAAREERVLAESLVSPLGKLQFRRGRTREDGRVELVSGPGSHLVAGLAASGLLVLVPEDVVELPAGASVETWTL